MHRIKFQSGTLYVSQLTNTIYIVGPLRMVSPPDRGVRGCLATALARSIIDQYGFYSVTTTYEWNILGRWRDYFKVF